jgi:hypothetical protein
MSNPIGIDFETYYNTKAKYGIKELGNDRYIDHALFDPYMISVSDGVDSWAGELRDFNWNSLDGQTVCAHNARFDEAVAEEAVKRGLADKFTPKEFLCTADMSSYICNRRSLKDASEFLLGVSLSKETRDYANGKTARDIKDDGRWPEMVDYARSDALRCQQLLAQHGHKWPAHERKLSSLTRRQGRRGIQIDVDKLRMYIVLATTYLRIAEEQLPWVKEGRPPTSPKAIAELCRTAGIPTPPVKSREGEDAFIAWETTYCAKYPWIEHVANWRSINKFLDSLQTIATRLDPEGVLGFSLKYFGAHTGRWSGDAGLNMQNLRKEPLFFDDRGWLISDLTRLNEIKNNPKRPDYVAQFLDIRSLFIARPGKKLVISDLAQIEPRVLAWIIGDTDMLSGMQDGQSPYEAHARATMGFCGDNMKKEDKDGYALAKARVLGLGYGCGWRKFIVVAQAMAGLDITLDDPELVQAVNDAGEPCFDSKGDPIVLSGYGQNSKRIVTNFRETNPAITALWKKLDGGFRDSVGSDFEMALPSGRSMKYRAVRREMRLVPQEEGPPKPKIVFTAESNGRRGIFYGGMLTENLVQATARDVFAEHLLDLDDEPSIDVLFSSHDEAITEVDPEIPASHVESIMSRCPDWLEGCPIAAEACESAYYKK